LNTRAPSPTICFAALLALALTLPPPTSLSAPIPTYDHVVIVIEENHAYDEIIGSPEAPYINNVLRAGGANFTQAYALTHPSLQNYLHLFSGSDQGAGDNGILYHFSTPNLASELIAAGRTFKGYSEDLDHIGSTAFSINDPYGYVRRHNPWVQFTNVPNGTTIATSSNLRWIDFPTPANYAQLPTVAMVVPNLWHDMHDGPISVGDAWLQANIGPYAQWARTHNSLLIVTYDEDDFTPENHIPTLVYGAGVLPGDYDQHIDHHTILWTLEEMYGLALSGQAPQPGAAVTLFSPEPASLTLPCAIALLALRRRTRSPPTP
jgi:acid phosphatase